MYDVTEGLDVNCTSRLRLSAVGTRHTRCKFDAVLPHRRRAISDSHRGEITIGEWRGGENKGAEVEEVRRVSGRVRRRAAADESHAAQFRYTLADSTSLLARRLRSCPLMIMDRPRELISVAGRLAWI